MLVSKTYYFNYLNCIQGMQHFKQKSNSIQLNEILIILNLVRILRLLMYSNIFTSSPSFRFLYAILI